MPGEKFRIEHLAGPGPVDEEKLREARRIWEPRWDLVKRCERAELYRQEALVILLWTMGLTHSMISRVTGVDKSNVGRTLRRAVDRISATYEIRGGASVAQAWSILWAFRNGKTRVGRGDHGPQLSGTRRGGYREVFPIQMVTPEDLTDDWLNLD